MRTKAELLAELNQDLPKRDWRKGAQDYVQLFFEKYTQGQVEEFVFTRPLGQVTPDDHVGALTETVGYLYNWTPDDDVVPFFTGGVGSANTDIDVLGSESDFTIYLGGGTRFYLNDRVSIRLDGRWMHIDTSPSTNNGVFTAGVSWVLGRGR